MVTRGSQTKSFGTPKREGHDSSAFYARKMLNGKHAPQAKKPQKQEWNKPPKQNTIYC